MTRIAYIVSEYPAPSHTFIRREIAELRRRGIAIDALSIRGTDARGDSPLDASERAATRVIQRGAASMLAIAAAEILRRPMRFARTLKLALTHRAPGAKAGLWSLFHLCEALVAAKLLREGGATHVHSHFANSGSTIALLAARFAGLPWSFTVHGISETDYPAGVMLGEKVRHADFVACASWFIRAQALRVVDPVYWDRTTIVRCGIDLTALPPVPEREAGQPVAIVCVGRLSSEKGHAGLLAAFGEVVASGQRATLELVGDGPCGDALRAQVAEAGLTDHVHFAGRLDERRTLERIAASDILVLPSLMEGLPVVLIEALALGKPVVSSWVAGVPELVEPDVNGLLFAPGDWARLAERLRTICADDALRTRLAENARARVAAEFAIDVAVRPLIARFGGADA
ncbi:glycosyltransferase [Sphingomonas floccifaciens]|uniref:Glycosyltransferase n=1 Tax=Sphingomonas floccifaciens TaxID=1844115 RepID=A0ABW4ND23_9SPHN